MDADYTHVKSLADALKVCRRQLEALGKKDLVPLLPESSVIAALRSALHSYAGVLNHRNAVDLQQQRDYFEMVAKPLYLSIANRKIWPAGASFEFVTSLTDSEGVVFEQFGARMRILTPDAYYPGFALPILDLHYGRFLTAIDNDEFNLVDYC